jgi:hypothetical protein
VGEKKPFEKAGKKKKYWMGKVKNNRRPERGRERHPMSAFTSAAIFAPEGHEFTYIVKHSDHKAAGIHRMQT